MARSFFSTLARGFVRSAVNQVGRDGGRVVSNNIYGGRNYVPVANVGAGGGSPQFGGSVADGSGAPYKSVTIQTRAMSPGRIIGLSLLSVLTAPVGSLGVIAYGAAQCLRRTDKVHCVKDVPQYINDARCTGGVRCIGTAEQFDKYDVPVSDETKAIHRRNGIIAIAIGAAGILFAVFCVLVS